MRRRIVVVGAMAAAVVAGGIAYAQSDNDEPDRFCMSEYRAAGPGGTPMWTDAEQGCELVPVEP